jgi:hypothetical protein
MCRTAIHCAQQTRQAITLLSIHLLGALFLGGNCALFDCSSYAPSKHNKIQTLASHFVKDSAALHSFVAGSAHCGDRTLECKAMACLNSLMMMVAM